MVMYEQCHRLQRFLITHSERMMRLSLSNTPKTTEIGTLLIRRSIVLQHTCRVPGRADGGITLARVFEIVSLRLNLACLVLLTLTLAENQISGFFRHQHAQEHHWQ
ncbi:hypothetical protein L3Y34_012866 [Caenorhabditis briggsae]|uniref:Uncharacterized protein n=1 Tax=Caenorhabditis briggsae TaxID=6238 RepID=A0AAE8ZTQ3_CAEBR|nr:hypothetical protein L3Y34_012866 [Caenorhabditis briggsae]